MARAFEGRIINLPELNIYIRFVKSLGLSLGKINRKIASNILQELKLELDKRVDAGKNMEGVEESWKTFEKKVSKIRPRFVGALASYALLSGLNNKQILDNNGLEMFKLMWFLGSAQDDYIDRGKVY